MYSIRVTKYKKTVFILQLKRRENKQKFHMENVSHTHFHLLLSAVREKSEIFAATLKSFDDWKHVILVGSLGSE
jgi:hypothetical protein